MLLTAIAASGAVLGGCAASETAPKVAPAAVRPIAAEMATAPAEIVPAVATLAATAETKANEVAAAAPMPESVTCRVGNTKAPPKCDDATTVSLEPETPAAPGTEL